MTEPHDFSHLRLYSPDECQSDGYPSDWHLGPAIRQVEEGGPCHAHPGVKNIVREASGNRCVRCGHPYAKGAGEWSPCDTGCTHGGPIRHHATTDEGDDWTYVDMAARTAEGIEVPVLVLTTLPGVTVQARWRILTVHHLNGVKWDLRWWNLTALCQRCHLQIQGKVQMERVYPWEHSEWFKPYVAGYYAWTYLGEDITRAEAEERMDELLALELAS